jgi:cyclic beta-1,2-glucan synthetase
MASVEQQLVDDEAKMIRLLAPAFDVCEHDPGYIKGYIPGVRENGGQYTHGVLWAVKATAQLGDTSRAAELLTMLSPVSHGSTPEQVALYQTEPYVVAADVYGVGDLTGRGGWTWYTGSAGWMYRVALEDVLGFHLYQGESIHLTPRLPSSWDRATLHYREPKTGTSYEIRIERDRALSPGALSASMDGEPLASGQGLVQIPFRSDGLVHPVSVTLGAPVA